MAPGPKTGAETGVLAAAEVADLNDDGLQDIVVANAATNNMGVLLGAGISLRTSDAAQAAFSQIDSLLDGLTSFQASVGAAMSRFEAALNNAGAAQANLQAAASRIMDADIAAEIAELTRQNIIQKAATAILAQANLQPSLVLTLLQMPATS